MEKKVIELVGIVFRVLIRNWAKENTIISQNLIDFEQVAQACGLQKWDSMKFNHTMQNYITDIAKNFFEDIEIKDNERKEEIINEIIKDVEKVNLSEETVALEFFKPNVLKNTILMNGQETVKLWSEKEKGLYENCVSYISKTCVEFVLKWPGFTPKALTVVLDRQDEYQKYLRKIINEIHTMKSLYKSAEVIYRDFENKYRETIIERYGKVELIGAGINNRKIKRYNITSAYVELNCLDYEDEIEISQVLRDSNVVWIGGEAGSGKTTFLNWVAICSARNDYKKVENIRGKLPIVIQVRRIQKWPINLQVYINEFAESFGYRCPEGWLEAQLKENRVLVLVDGLDEVSENRRDDVYDFVDRLLEKYPKIKIILTARNSVREEVGFYEKRYEICPMKMSNIKKFIRYWYRTILHDDAVVDDRKIKQLENNLIGRIGNSSTLKNLARTPLLCAMLCALNYINEQHLPENKMELYESCCKMLIDSRDAERGIQKSDDKNLKLLDYSKKKMILEELAYWMLRNNNASELKENVIIFLDNCFKNMNIIASVEREYKTEKILDFLIERSGIIREPEKDVIDFIHKTFMEYLAVESIYRNCDWGRLVDEVCNPNWKETIIMCFSKMGERQVSSTLRKMMKKAEEEKDERYILMASLCAANATFTNFKMQDKIEQQISKLIPPKKEQISEMAQAGNYLLPFLMDKNEFSNDDRLNCLLLLYNLDNEDTLPDVVSYIQGNGNVKVKEIALEILSEYDDTILYEQGIKEQLQEVLFKEIRNDKLITHDLLLGMIDELEISKKGKEILENIRELHVIGNMKNENDYYGHTEFHKYFSGVKKLSLSGEIEDVDFLDYYNYLEELVFSTAGNLSPIFNSIAGRRTLQSIKKLVIHAGQIDYFTDNDLRNMINLEELEIECLSEQVEIDFDTFENNKKLRKIILKLNEGIIEELDNKIERLNNKREELKIVVKSAIIIDTIEGSR